MLIYFQILQKQLNTAQFYNPIKKIKIPYTKNKLIIPNTQYWKEIQTREFSTTTNDSQTRQIKHLYFMYIETISKQINTKVLSTTPEILTKEKYRAYKLLITNMFLDTTTREKIQTIFETTQKHYFALTRFSRHIHKILQRKNQTNQHKITTDLSLMPLNPQDKYTFIVYENTNNTQNSYLFSIPDLINIIQTAITNAPNFFEKPLQPKNPYTNIPFSTNTLQAFFYKLHKMYYPIPPTLENYYKCQYNLKQFQLQNQMEIRDIAIKKFVTNSPTTVLHQEILDMINEYFYDPQEDKCIEIDNEFPKQQLVNIMRPYLYVFLMGEYHIHGSEKRSQAKRVFRRAKQIFMNYNPRFGEQIPPPPLPPQSKESTKTREKSTTPQGSQGPLPNTQLQPPSPTFVFTQQPQQQQQTSIFIFKSPQENNIHPNKNTQNPKFFDEHPKFSMKDIEIYLQDPSKLKQPQPIRRPRSPPPRPRYMNFDTEDEESDIDP